MPRIRRSLLLVLASGLGACDVPIEVHPTADLEFEPSGGGGHRWQAEARALEQRIGSLEQQIEQRREQKWALPASFSAAVAAEEARLDGQIELLEAELERAEERLSALEDGARRAGVSPDGLR